MIVVHQVNDQLLPASLWQKETDNASGLPHQIDGVKLIKPI